MTHQTVHALFEKAAHTYAANIAIEETGSRTTYEEVNRRANKLAHLLRTLGASRDATVKAFMPSCTDLVVAALSIMKAGAVFLPISAAFSHRRLIQIFEQFPEGILIVNTQLASMVKELAEALHLSVSFLIITDPVNEFTVWRRQGAEWELQPLNSEDFSVDNPAPVTEPDDGCYIHYTSGTTGYGKAILGRHKSLHHFITWEIEEFGVTPDFRISQLSQVAFDPYLRDVFVPLCAGGILCIPDEETKNNMALLLDWLHEQHISLIHVVPTVFRLLTKELERHEDPASLFGNLRFVLLAGEILYAKDLLNWKQMNAGPVEFVNLYGPSETTLAKVFHRIQDIPADPSRIMHVGKPITHTAVAIFNNGHPCNVGEIGEVYIKTPFLSKGYLFDPELNKKMFVQNPLVTDRKDIIYRTGDLGRFLSNMDLEIVGRADNQVKIHGIRIELGEIEQAVLRHGKVKETVITVYRKENQQDELVCYYTGEEVTEEQLRVFLQGEMNKNIAPAYFIRLDEFPVNINGKVDRKALPRPDLFITDTGYVPPEGATETSLAAVWKEVLGLSSISRNISFFKLGGTSTKAIQVVSRIYRDLKVNIKVADIFSSDTVEKLALIVDRAAKTTYRGVQPLEEQDYYEVSHAQQRLWTIHQLPGKQHMYNISSASLLKGPLDVPVFIQAWQVLLMRHESLRTMFTTVKGRPVQKIRPITAMPDSLVYTPAVQGNNIDAWIEEETSRPFDLEKGPLVSARLVNIQEETHLLIFTIHHIICDGWSMNVLLDDVVTLYNNFRRSAQAGLPVLPLQYRDYSMWHNLQVTEDTAAAQYWQQQFEGEIPVLELPVDRQRPAIKTYEGNKYDFNISAADYTTLTRYCENRGVSIYMLLFTAVNALLYRYTGQQDIIIGSPVMGREREELENQVGFYVNTLALRTKFDPLKSFSSLLAATKQVILGAFEHKLYPFDLLVEKLDARRDWSRSPLFDVWIVLQNLNYRRRNRDNMDGITIEMYEQGTQVSLHDLSFNFYEGEELEVSLVYNTNLFNRDTVVRMAGHLQQLLIAAVNNDQQPVATLPYLHTDEYKALEALNPAPVNYPQTAKPLYRIFEENLPANEMITAVQDGERSLTYRELYEKSSALCTYLRHEAGLQNGQVVALLLDRSVDIVVAMLAALKAGCAYLPIYPGDPADRINYILQDAAPALLITHSAHLSSLTDLTAEVFAMDIQSDTLIYHPDEAAWEVSTSEAAYIIYTSGSTGQPKGAIVPHSAVSNLVCGLHENYLNGENHLNIAVVAPSIFDPFGKQVFLALLHGHSLFIVPEKYKRSGAALWEYYRNNKIIHTDATPGYLQLLLGSLPETTDSMPLQYFWVGGAALPGPHVKKLGEFFEGKNWTLNVLNEYGLTECCVDNTCYAVNMEMLPEAAIIPIGKPLPNNYIYILDKQLQLVPKGVAGEICIAGAGVGAGYLNNQVLTAQKFATFQHPDGRTVPVFRTGDMGKWLADGNLQYIARQDDQVKVRGYRVEPGEITARMRNIKGITDACVVVKDDAYDNILIAYYTGNEIAPAAIRSALSEFLPEYMIPAYMVWLKAFPLTTNGKLDKRALPAPQQLAGIGREYTPPVTSIEKELAAIWEEVLNVQGISVNDNFFEIGGHSLKAVQIASRIFAWCQVRIEVAALFSHPTIRQLAAYIGDIQPTYEFPLHAIEEQDYYRASHAQKRMWILDEQYIFNTFGAWLIEGPLDIKKLDHALKLLVARHEILHTTLQQIDDTVIQRVREADDNGFRLEVTDLSAHLQAEEIINEIIQAEKERRFDLVAGPLIRSRIIIWKPGHHVLLLSMHHSISDGRSLDIVADGIFAGYSSSNNSNGYNPGALTLQYKDYSAWQQVLLNDANSYKHSRYWKEHFSDYTGTPEMLHDYPRPAIRSGNAGSCTFTIAPENTAALKAIAASHNVSLFTVLLSVIKVLLYRYTGHREVITGTTVANRTHKELEDQIGYYINILPLSTRLNEDATFVMVLDKVRAMLLEAYEHQVYPFDQLVEDLQIKRSAARAPLFDILVQLNNASKAEDAVKYMDDLKVSAWSSGVTEGIMDLMFLFTENTADLELVINFDTDLYKEETVLQIQKDLMIIITYIIADNNCRIEHIPLITSLHEKSLLDDFVRPMQDN